MLSVPEEGWSKESAAAEGPAGGAGPGHDRMQPRARHRVAAGGPCPGVQAVVAPDVALLSKVLPRFRALVVLTLDNRDASNPGELTPVLDALQVGLSAAMPSLHCSEVHGASTAKCAASQPVLARSSYLHVSYSPQQRERG